MVALVGGGSEAVDRMTSRDRTSYHIDILTERRRLLMREAYHLSGSHPVNRPGYVTQQLCLQALASEDSELVELARS